MPVIKRNGVVLIHDREMQALSKGKPFPSAELDARPHDLLHISCRTLSKRLAVTEETAARLLRSEFFRRFHNEASEISRLGVPLPAWCRFEVAVSELFAKRLTGRVPREYISLGEVIRTRRNYGLDYAGLLQRVVDGTITAGSVLVGGVGLGRLMLKRTDIERLVSMRRKKLFGELLDGAEVCRRLGLNSRSVLAHLENKRFIKSRSAEGLPGGARGYEPAECQRFEERLIGLVKLQATLGGSRRYLRQRLAAAGVMPVTGPEIDGCDQIFYRRNDLRKIWPDALPARRVA